MKSSRPTNPMLAILVSTTLFAGAAHGNGPSGDFSTPSGESGAGLPSPESAAQTGESRLPISRQGQLQDRIALRKKQIELLQLQLQQQQLEKRLQGGGGLTTGELGAVTLLRTAGRGEDGRTARIYHQNDIYEVAEGDVIGSGVEVLRIDNGRITYKLDGRQKQVGLASQKLVRDLIQQRMEDAAESDQNAGMPPR